LAQKGRSAQAIGRSRGGWTTKVHALTDVVGRPYVLMLTGGNISDVKAAPALLERAGRMRYLLGNKGYDADRLRRVAREAGAIPVIPGRRNRKRTIHYDKQRYADRHLIENAFCRLRTSAALPPATTSSPPTSCPQWLSSLPSPFGADHTFGENCG
jgi:transposase